MSIDNITIANALNTLAEQEDYREARNNLMVIVGITKTAFVEDLTPLNVLVQYGRKHGGPEALLPLLKITDEARLPPQSGDNEPAVNPRRAYQAPYMKDRRRRYKKAALIKMMSLPAHIRKRYPRGMPRVMQEQFEDYLDGFWADGKNKVTANILDYDAKLEAGRRYWEDLEALLDQTYDLLNDPRPGTSAAAAVKKAIGEWHLPDKST